MDNVKNWFVGTMALVVATSTMLVACSSDERQGGAVSSTIESMQTQVADKSDDAMRAAKKMSE